MPNVTDLHNLNGANLAVILDRQHSEIKQKQKNLRASVVEGMGMNQIVACAKDLIDTTLDHFKSEECAMEISRFTGLLAHKHLHDGMAKSVNEIWSDLEHRKINAAMQLLTFFDERLTFHLDWEDGPFGRKLDDK
jgi:hemerythrin-like metal-binding protein